ncbi:PLP-dependent transferase [Lophiostoma macrostomum CBS 122681]|uniref:PLP-dependent transferase n=1 Tax=Lophiostoma macrostomum CBS 122681 TaxID=1314788 RepID=A0A6A6SMH9_9PLEO|nr:PLP-dependent transferase [Lophiostoma macrostomum CBS 122681]
MQALSTRVQKTASELDVPWRFVTAGPAGKYDPDNNPSGVVTQLTSAENHLVQQELTTFVNEVHTAGGSRLPAALAVHLNEFWKPHTPLIGSDIRITSSATALHEILGFSLLNPGQGILTSRPYYGRFEIDFGFKAGVKIVPVNTASEECFLPSVVNDFESALQESNANGIGIRAILITNPHNPLGRCYPKQTLIDLMKFCQKHQIHFLSDEIYSLTVFDSAEPNTYPFTSVLSIEPVIDPDLLHVIYGMAKDYGAPGFRIGALITRSKALHKAFTSIVRFHNPSGLSVAYATAMLEDRQWCRSFLELSRERIRDAYRYITTELNRIGLEYLPGSNAGLYVWVDMSRFLGNNVGSSNERREQELSERALRHGILLQPGEEHDLKAGWYRLVYTTERRVLEEGLRR